MSKKKKSLTVLREPRFRVQFFDHQWTELESLKKEGDMGRVLMEVALWARSRDLDKNDEDLIVYTIYHNAPFITVEELTDEQKKREELDLLEIFFRRPPKSDDRSGASGSDEPAN
jgi:hypothetical protein